MTSGTGSAAWRGRRLAVGDPHRDRPHLELSRARAIGVDHAFYYPRSPAACATIRAVSRVRAELFEGHCDRNAPSGTASSLARRRSRRPPRLAACSSSRRWATHAQRGDDVKVMRVPRQQPDHPLLMPDGPTACCTTITSVATIDPPGPALPADASDSHASPLEQARMLFADHRAEFDRDFPPSPIRRRIA